MLFNWWKSLRILQTAFQRRSSGRVAKPPHAAVNGNVNSGERWGLKGQNKSVSVRPKRAEWKWTVRRSLERASRWEKYAVTFACTKEYRRYRITVCISSGVKSAGRSVRRLDGTSEVDNVLSNWEREAVAKRLWRVIGGRSVRSSAAVIERWFSEGTDMFSWNDNRQLVNRMIDYYETKSQPITRKMVWEAYKEVRSNRGGSGADGMTWSVLDTHAKSYLYKLWNRMSSGSYFPPPVLEVEI